MMELEARLAEYRDKIEPALSAAFGKARGLYFDGLLDAMDYSITAGGKRIRPILTLEFCRVCGGDLEAAMPAACAVEMLHTYSLIHDDLPCMDNDVLRRGKPTNHVKFGCGNAVLAGDALQAEAFGTILRSSLPADRRAGCAAILADAAGIDGICGGQYMDLNDCEGRETADFLLELDSRKTGALLAAACRMGAAAAGGTEEQLAAAAKYGYSIGLAFQIRDDMLDVISSDAELGKTVGSDADKGKATFMTLLGEAECLRLIDVYTRTAVDALETFPDAGILSGLALNLAGRRS